MDLDLVGRTGRVTRHSWTARDSSLYALGIGAGQDPLTELEYTSENVGAQRAYPSMAVAIGVAGIDRPSFGQVDRSALVHAGESLRLHAPLPVEGEVELTCTITGLHDKGSGALITWQTEAVDVNVGMRPLFTVTSSGFLRGGGGFGGDRGESGRWAPPDRAPDAELLMTTRPEQALIYRLSGDRNPLHNDPATASRGGYARPILHGLCMLGFSARTISNQVGRELTSVGVRFAKVAYPGDEYTVRLWENDDAVTFQTLDRDGAVVLDRGELGFS